MMPDVATRRSAGPGLLMCVEQITNPSHGVCIDALTLCTICPPSLCACSYVRVPPPYVPFVDYLLL
jgi:hypothetical protein